MIVKIEEIRKIAERELAKNNDPAHDISHVQRVFNLAQVIAKDEKEVDLQILELATLLHDIGEAKELDDPSGKTDHALISAEMAGKLLKNCGLEKDKIEHIKKCITSHRYKTEHRPETIEAKILFDADKLDSLGAIGVARAFCWVGKNNANIYKKVNINKYIKNNANGKINGRIQDKTKHSPQIELAVKWKNLGKKLFTKTAKKIYKNRLKFLEDFLNRLESEIKGDL